MLSPEPAAGYSLTDDHVNIFNEVTVDMADIMKGNTGEYCLLRIWLMQYCEYC